MQRYLLLCMYLLGLVATPAQAGFVMIVDDPMTAGFDFRVEDGGINDTQSIAGLIGFSGAVGGIQVGVTGESKGAIGSVSSPELMLTLNPSAGPSIGSITPRRLVGH